MQCLQQFSLNGTTTIENAAKEPHIVDLANFLNKMGANIMGAGTDRIRIQGVKELKKDETYSVVPDQIEVRDIDGEILRIICNKRPNKVSIKTLPYPGFPTDLQPPMGVAMSIANGTSVINESIWDSRFQYTEELNRMGAKITAQGKVAFFEGVDKLVGAPVYAPDLRAGAALVIAGIVAEGTTQIYNVEHIDRGYEKIEQKFIELGAKIKRVDQDEII